MNTLSKKNACSKKINEEDEVYQFSLRESWKFFKNVMKRNRWT